LLNNMMTQGAPTLDLSNYPSRWSEYIGQEKAKKVLQVASKSARMRKAPLPHTLIAHPTPGIGKTALAVLTSIELGRPVRMISGQVHRDYARLLFSEMEDNDVLIYDEAHQMMDAGKKKAEWLLHYLQDGVIMGPLGPEPQPRVTIIAATTDANRIPENIRSRFECPPLTDYTTEEAAKIVTLMSGSLMEGLPKVTGVQAEALASAAANNPRAIRRLLLNLRDMTLAGELTRKGRLYDIEGLLAFQGISPDGLDPTMQKYLVTLASEFQGTAGAKTLEDRLQQPGGLGTVERTLMEKGYVAKTRTGRTLTQAGIRRYRELAKEMAA
jgi:holliday junction DNA helicase RuvB